MATYKVIQDIEAEDKLLGPLTLRQFIYAIIVVVCGFLAFKLALVAWYLALPLLPPMILFGIIAAPLGGDQSSEIWLLAKLRFFLKPRLRIWDQTGMVELVSITVPKVIDASSYTDNLSQTEVTSRLKALSETIDSRGWAVKNIDVNLFAQPGAIPQVTSPTSDRLLDLPDAQFTPKDDIKMDEDMLDEKNNPVAQQLDQMIGASTKTHREKTLHRMADIRKHQAEIKNVRPVHETTAGGNWFIEPVTITRPGNDASTAQNFSPNTAGQTASFATTDDSTIQPRAPALPTVVIQKKPTKTQAASVTPAPDPGILNLAENDDLNVATIARQANRQAKPDIGEVTISLH